MAPALFDQLRTFLEDKCGRDSRAKPYKNMLDALHTKIGAIERVIGTATPEQIAELEGLRCKEDELRSKVEAIYNSKRITFRIDAARLDPRILEEMRAEHMGVHRVKKRTISGNDEDSVRSKRIRVSGDDKNLRHSKRIRKTPDRPGMVKMHGEEEDDAYDEGELTQEQTDEKIAELRRNTVLTQGDSGTFYSCEDDYEDEDIAHQNDECEMNSEVAAGIEAIETFANDETYSSDDEVQALDETGVDTRLSRNRQNKPHDRILRCAMKEPIGLEPEPETLLSNSNAHMYITPENVIKRWKEGRIDDIDDPITMQKLQSALKSEVRIKFSTLDIKRIHIHTKDSGSHNPFDTDFMKTILRLRDKSERDAERNSRIYEDEATQRIHEQHEEELASEGRESWMEPEGFIERSSFYETAGMPAMTEGEANLTPADLTATPPNASGKRPIQFSAGIRFDHEVSQAAQPTTVIPSTNRADELIDATRSMSPDGRSDILNAQIGIHNAITDAATADKENPGSAASNDSNDPQPSEPLVLKLGLPISSEPQSEPSHRRHQDELLLAQTPSKGLRSETRIETNSRSGTAGSSGSATSAFWIRPRFRPYARS